MTGDSFFNNNIYILKQANEYRCYVVRSYINFIVVFSLFEIQDKKYSKTLYQKFSGLLIIYTYYALK